MCYYTILSFVSIIVYIEAMSTNMNLNLSVHDGPDFITDTRVLIPEEGSNEMSLTRTGSYRPSPQLDVMYRTENVTQWLTSDYNVTDGIIRNGSESYFVRDESLTKMEIALQVGIRFLNQSCHCSYASRC